MLVLKLLLLLPLLVLLLQMYNYAVTKQGAEKQKTCQGLGIACTTFGIVSLAFHSLTLTFAGFFLIMIGLRLIAHGLDRQNKTVFIDRYEGDLRLAAEHSSGPSATAAPQESAADYRKNVAEENGTGVICSVPESSPS